MYVMSSEGYNSTVFMCCRMSSISSPASGSLQIKWDPKNLEIRTKSVEKTLEPLVTQVTSCRLLFNLLILTQCNRCQLVKFYLTAFQLTNGVILVVVCA